MSSNPNTQPMTKKEKAIQQVGISRGNLLLMIVLTAVNIILFALGSDTMLLFSATVPYLTALFGVITEVWEFMIAGYAISAVVILLYLLCWIFSKKHYGWSIAALVMFLLDSLVMVWFYVGVEDFSGVLDVLIHIWVLYYLVIGVINGYKLKNIPPEEELEYVRAEQQEVEAPVIGTEANSLPIRRADESVKSRILIEGDFVGHHICYRRVKRINELVIDGLVYDDIEMLVEGAHALNAVIDGHRIQVGFDGMSHSYIRVDGNQVARKLRLI